MIIMEQAIKSFLHFELNAADILEREEKKALKSSWYASLIESLNHSEV